MIWDCLGDLVSDMQWRLRTLASMNQSLWIQYTLGLQNPQSELFPLQGNNVLLAQVTSGDQVT